MKSTIMWLRKTDWNRRLCQSLNRRTVRHYGLWKWWGRDRFSQSLRPTIYIRFLMRLENNWRTTKKYVVWDPRFPRWWQWRVWVVTPCSLSLVYRHSRGMHCLRLDGGRISQGSRKQSITLLADQNFSLLVWHRFWRWRQYTSPKRKFTATRLQGIT
jgi:hypothetical protein